MSLQLTITNLESDSKYEAVKIFKKGGTIGRDPDRDWIFNNPPKNNISGKHATIEYANKNFFIVDTSSNGTFLNGKLLNKNSQNILKNNDKIEMRPFFIDVVLLPPEKKPSVSLSDDGDDFGNNSSSNNQNKNQNQKPTQIKNNVSNNYKETPYQQNINSMFTPENPIHKMEVPKYKTPSGDSFGGNSNLEPEEFNNDYSELEQVSATNSPSPSSSESDLFKLFLKRFDIRESALRNSNLYYVIELSSHILYEVFRCLIKISYVRQIQKQELNFARSMVLGEIENPFKMHNDLSALALQIFSRKENKLQKNPVLSVKEIFEEDIIPHNEATISGCKAVFKGIIEIFNPNRMKQFADKKKVYDFTSTRYKAQMFDLMCAEHARLVEAAENDRLIPSLFKEEFQKAYDKTIRGR